MAARSIMIHEAKDIHPKTTIDADVLVIGSGAGGAVVATELAEAGRSVAVLEEGGYYPATKFTQREDDMFGLLMGRQGPDWTEDYAVNFAYDKAVGGSTNSYWADSFRAPEDRIDKWAEEFGLREFTAATLDPHFRKTAQKAGISRVPDHVVNKNNRKFAAAAGKLGWSAPRIERAAHNCIGSGFCELGCAYSAKGLSFSYLPRGLARGLDIFADCRADRFLMRDGRLQEVTAHVLDRATGKPRHEIRARGRVVVVACGGLGSPYLLLKNGIGGPTGKTLYWNPHLPVFCLYDEPMYSYAGVPCAHHLDEFRLVRTHPDGSYKEGGFTSLCGFVHPGSFGGTTTPWGTTFQRMMDAFYRMGGSVSVIDDEEPGTVRVGAKGERVIEVWFGPKDKLKARDYFRKMATLFLAAGATEVYLPDVDWTTVRSERDLPVIDRLSIEPQTLMVSAAHLMGTCRMGEDPQRAVVNSYCRAHAVPNLFITDASALPTSVSVDPSWTIMTIASRAADYIANNWAVLRA
ncbi:MAG: GMC family oxidoreductase N-terminal domain-containing protein [Candidatus Binatia bacterium]